MKIIDLLNKMANGEEVPKYIKYYDKLHQREDIMMCCYNNIIYKLDNNIIDLLDEVEIIEEEKKIPEKLEDYDFDDGLDANTKCECLRERMQEIENQLDEIIDFLKQN